MQLYEINTDERDVVHVVARTPDEAFTLSVTWLATFGGISDLITVQRLPVEDLKPEQQVQVRSAFAAGLVGISHFEERGGWTFSAPLWQPPEPEDQPRPHDGGNV
jgi:hypothetical protein